MRINLIFGEEKVTMVKLDIELELQWDERQTWNRRRRPNLESSPAFAAPYLLIISRHRNPVSGLKLSLSENEKEFHASGNKYFWSFLYLYKILICR